MTHTVATTDELQSGDRKFVQIKGIEITVLNIDGKYYAIRNSCPHMEGPVGRGPTSRNDHGQPIIDCPFHNWTFDLETGEVSFGHSKRLATYDVAVVDDEIRVEL